MLAIQLVTPTDRNEDETSENVVFRGISTTADEILKTEGGVCQSVHLQTATTHQKENRVVRVRLRDDGQAYQLSFTLTKKTSETICPALCRRSRLVVTPMSTQKTGKDGLATSMRILGLKRLWNTQLYTILQTPTCNSSTAERKNNSKRIDLEALCVPTICGVPAKPELNAWQHLKKQSTDFAWINRNGLSP
ncbi:hypothetical protein Tsp_05126 [Trichinella spiralis]|uniref:hypothetical protein n=1 Tax=Trichinella spiralis TaxID=6334 RepID=UPI0001EFD1D3|nr:hypothetical protein Tsp_05126 [Trichinella spiralis]